MPAAQRILNGVVATGASDVFPISGYGVIRVQVWSAAGSVATVQIQTRSDDSAAPWYPEATITNPSAVGEMWVIPTAGQLRAVVTAWTSGAVNVNLERYNQWR